MVRDHRRSAAVRGIRLTDHVKGAQNRRVKEPCALVSGVTLGTRCAGRFVGSPQLPSPRSSAPAALRLRPRPPPRPDRSAPSGRRPRPSPAASTRTGRRPRGTSSTGRARATARRRRRRTRARARRAPRSRRPSPGSKPGRRTTTASSRRAPAGTGHGDDGILTTSPRRRSSRAARRASRRAPRRSTAPSIRAAARRAGTSSTERARATARRRPRRTRAPGTSTVSVSAAITSLTAGRTYHFRLVATSDAGTSRGSDQHFLATAAPSVTTKSASSVKDTTATLNASVNPNGQSTTVYFEYGTTTGYGSKTSAKSIGSGSGATNVAIGWSGLAPGVTYHFRARRLECGGDEHRRRPDVHDDRAAVRAQQRGNRHQLEQRDAQRLGRSERAHDELVLPVRAGDELRAR